MKNYVFIILSLVIFLGGCTKDREDEIELEITAEGKITGKVNGVDIGMASIVSEVNGTGDNQTLYITAKKDFESFSKPATNGKQFLIRVQSYKGTGIYSPSEQTFWTYTENINGVDAANVSYKAHRFTTKEPKGSMTLEITADKTVDGKRIITGKFSGESGSTLQTTIKAGAVEQKEIALEAFKLTDINFVAPPK